jgi:XXXCH domain-containing protein
MSNECRIERYMPKEALPDFLRELADALQQGGKEGEFDSVGEFYKLKLNFKDEFGQIRVKLKIRTSKPCRGRGGGGKEAEGMPRYKNLKKDMKHSFKMIRKMLRDGQTPPAEAVAAFLADAERMTRYPGKGDAFYPEFRETCRELSEAGASGDLARMKAAAEELARQKSRCHDMHK